MSLTDRYNDALTFAATLHREQIRKGTQIPYISHLLAVSSLVLEAGGNEDLAIAGLLHDSLEDQGEQVSYEGLVDRYGPRVAEIVRACSDDEPPPGQEKRPWRRRKQDYVAHLGQADADVLMVSRADKLHNARSILMDARSGGAEFWKRFNAPKTDQLWYYTQLSEAFCRRLPGPQSDELARVVAAMIDLD